MTRPLSSVIPKREKPKREVHALASLRPEWGGWWPDTDHMDAIVLDIHPADMYPFNEGEDYIRKSLQRALVSGKPLVIRIAHGVRNSWFRCWPYEWRQKIPFIHHGADVWWMRDTIAFGREYEDLTARVLKQARDMGFSDISTKMGFGQWNETDLWDKQPWLHGFSADDYLDRYREFTLTVTGLKRIFMFLGGLHISESDGRRAWVPDWERRLVEDVASISPEKFVLGWHGGAQKALMVNKGGWRNWLDATEEWRDKGGAMYIEPRAGHEPSTPDTIEKYQDMLKYLASEVSPKGDLIIDWRWEQYKSAFAEPAWYELVDRFRKGEYG